MLYLLSFNAEKKVLAANTDGPLYNYHLPFMAEEKWNGFYLFGKKIIFSFHRMWLHSYVTKLLEITTITTYGKMLWLAVFKVYSFFKQQWNEISSSDDEKYDVIKAFFIDDLLRYFSLLLLLLS